MVIKRELGSGLLITVWKADYQEAIYQRNWREKMKDRSSSASRASERIGFLRRVRHYSTSSNKSSDFDSLDDETVNVSSLRRRSSSSKQSKRYLTKNISNSSCDSEVFVEKKRLSG